METFPEKIKGPGQMNLRELHAARHNAFLQRDIDTLRDISGTAKARAESLGGENSEGRAYDALDTGCENDIEGLLGSN